MASAEAKYAHKCDFCRRRFKTSKAMYIHRANCAHNYATTDEVFTVEEIVGVFDHIDARFFLVNWEGYNEPEWERERTSVAERQMPRQHKVVLGKIRPATDAAILP